MFLSQECKENLVNAIIVATTASVNEFYREERLTHRNGYHFLKWDYTFTSIEKIFSNSESIKCVKINRGFFSFDLIADINNRYVFSVLKEKNLQAIIRKRDYSHYLWELASVNKNMKAYPSQTSLFEIEMENFVSNDILNKLDFVPEKYITILVDDSKRQMPKISLVVLNSKLERVYEEVIADVSTVSFDECIEKPIGEKVTDQVIKLELSEKSNIRKNKNRKESIKGENQDVKENN